MTDLALTVNGEARSVPARRSPICSHLTDPRTVVVS
jgi:hypothetical protein